MANTELNEERAQPGEWGFRPDGVITEETPPAFVWRPQEDAVTYDLQCARASDFKSVFYEKTGLTYSAHRPSGLFESGAWFWRFRFVNSEGQVSPWSQVRDFEIAENAKPLPMPEREDLVSRIPDRHPRLFLRPEQLDDLRNRAQGDLKAGYDELVATCEAILADMPPTQEPPTYPEGTVRLGEPWREIWWGNRVYTIRTLNSAATLAFTRLLGGQAHYGEKARELLMACAEWDPMGATGYRYNDEAGMPYNYYFCRTYSFVNDLLTEAEREKCREVMRIRGREMYEHLAVEMKYLWHPYGSHAGRAWHFLGEIGVTFVHEIPEAEEWVWFAMNVFGAVYPAWCDEDGGWHQGLQYWASYIQRFTWWADIMRAAMGVNAFDMPYFSRAGDFPMYLQPPGTRGGGVGDLTTLRTSDQNVGLVTILAALSQNPHWKWYVDQHAKTPGPETEAETNRRRLGAVQAGNSHYIDFMRGSLPGVQSESPEVLPTSKVFRGIGLAVMNASLVRASDNVEVIFKSSPLGSQSHGFDAQNSFSLFAYGERLLIHTGQRDIHGSDHHKNWMHHTRSTNCITVNGESQVRNSAAAIGRIRDFSTKACFDYVCGEAGEAYAGKLSRFTRRILFAKPDVVIIFDTLVAPEPSSFQYLLHAETEMAIEGQTLQVAVNKAACRVSLLHPQRLTISQTDRFDPPPRDRVPLTEYHVTAEPAEKSREQIFIAVCQPHRVGEALAGPVMCEAVGKGYSLRVPLANGELCVLLQSDGGRVMAMPGLECNSPVAALRLDEGGSVAASFVSGMEAS
ncbi:MAG: DUF4962 domain-containing protein [bacterium]|jgi:hypothetical protein|nr:DUF4962 domain-containing protein [bacterium]